jgi:dTDP-4-dehydrorhamnose reductase
MQTILFGASGLLGQALLRQWAQNKKEDQLIGPSSKDVDIRDAAQVSQLIERIRPGWIILSAAYTDVDACETDPKRAMDVNFHGPINVARAAKNAGSRLVFLSTDYVFDGSKSTPYEAGDPRSPLGVYGRSKVDAEIAVAEILPEACIARTSWLFGLGRRNFCDVILDAAASRPSIEVVSDQTGCPTYALDAAGALLQLCEKRASGIVHVTSGGHATRFDFAREIVARAGSPTEVRPTTGDKFPRPAARPKYSVLSPRSLEAYGITMPSWQNALARYLEERRALQQESRGKG